MLILGIHMTGSQSAAALFKDNKIVYAVAEERINRIKQSNAFPFSAIKECLEYAGVKDLNQIDDIAVSWNPMQNMKNINMSGFTSWRRYDPEWLYIVPNNLTSFIDEVSDFSTFSWNQKNNINYVNHHNAHLGQSIYQSPFEECACLISDEYSELPSITLAKAQGNDIEIIKQIEFPHSLGAFYAMITEFLGFRPNSDEWKVMGAAAYGDLKYYDKLKSLIHWDADKIDLILDLKYFNHFNMKKGTYIADLFEEYMELPKRKQSDELLQVHYDIAASMQKVFEEIVFSILKTLYSLTGMKNIVLGGGSFMNSLFNGKVMENTNFENIFVPYSAADNGGAVGAALWLAHNKYKVKRDKSVVTPYLAKEFSNDEIEKTLQSYKINYVKEENIAKTVAEYIAKGYIIGWFQGRMEYGERALGNRSILADPRNEKMKDIINASIKFREGFRPFAPAILKEEVTDFFDIPENINVPYMEQVYPIKENMKSKIPAVAHADGTGRLQMVDKNINSRFYTLINEFKKITGVPVVINTSFNLNGEPIVYTPSDALRTFFTSGLDILVVGDYIVKK